MNPKYFWIDFSIFWNSQHSYIFQFLKNWNDSHFDVCGNNLQLFQFNWNYIKYMSTEMKSYGDSGLVPTSRECFSTYHLDCFHHRTCLHIHLSEVSLFNFYISSNYYTRSVKAAILFHSNFIISIGLKYFYLLSTSKVWKQINIFLRIMCKILFKTNKSNCLDGEMHCTDRSVYKGEWHMEYNMVAH